MTVQVAVELREASVAEVKYAQRLIEVIAVPYERPAKIRYRGQTWNEVFERGAFDGIESRQGKVRANRDHDRTRTVGKVVNFWPSRSEGLVAEVRIAQTTLGDETLALADEDMLSASIGFGIKRGSDEVLEKRTMTRRIRRAFLDHLSFVESPAYDDAQILAVRDPRETDSGLTLAADLPKLETPDLDELMEWHRNWRR